MSQCSKFRSVRKGEQGSILILGAFLLVALLAVVGLAVDAGNLYWARLELQKAVDTAALAGIGATIHQSDKVRGLEGDAVREFVTERALEVAMHNLKLSRIKVDRERDLNADYQLSLSRVNNAPVYQLRVTASAEIPFLLMHLVPFEVLGTGRAGRSATVNALAAEAVAERAQANISLLLDTSRSMACPSKGDCVCLSPERTVDCIDEAAARQVPTKIALLKDSVRAFLEEFDSGLDRVSMIPFNLVASVDNNYRRGDAAVRFEPADGENVAAQHGFEHSKFEKALQNMRASSATNVGDAFIRGFKEAERVNLIQGSNSDQNNLVSYVYFSDGAPTAGRFFFSDLENLEPNPVSSTPPGRFDYVNYSVDWLDTETPSREDSQELNVHEQKLWRWTAPGPLLKAQHLSLGQESIVPPQQAQVSCEIEAQNGSSAGPLCLSSLAAHRPYSSGEIYGMEYQMEDGVFSPRWREQYYNSAIEYSDFLRKQGGRVFVVALGEPAEIRNDPYQDVSDTASVKSVFLARVSNDYSAAVRRPRLLEQEAYPEFSYSGYRSYEELRAASPQSEGEYLATDDASALKKMFKTVATRILLRLVK